MPTGRTRKQRRAAARAKPAAQHIRTAVAGAQYNAVIVYERSKGAPADHHGRMSDFYLDSVVVGSRHDAEAELTAARMSGIGIGAKGICEVFLAPITAGFRGLTEPLKRGETPAEFNVWLLRRDGADGLREYEVKFTKSRTSDAPPEHDPNLWLCTQIGEGWQRPEHIAAHEERRRQLQLRAARVAAQKDGAAEKDGAAAGAAPRMSAEPRKGAAARKGAAIS